MDVFHEGGPQFKLKGSKNLYCQGGQQYTAEPWSAMRAPPNKKKETMFLAGENNTAQHKEKSIFCISMVRKIELSSKDPRYKILANKAHTAQHSR